jgi:uncharacterized protein
MQKIMDRLAEEIGAKITQVSAAVTLLDEGATVPFISRYRKEVTGGLDDTQLRLLEERLSYLRELEDRRETILVSITEQGKLTPQLAIDINEADTKTRLEDLYLPFKPKRRTKGQIAREAGLQPLADTLLNDPTQHPETLATHYLNTEHSITTTKEALEGAKYILMEQFAEEANLITQLREHLWNNGLLYASVIEGKEKDGDKFKDYFEYHEAINTIPSHRILAAFRGRQEGVLSLRIDVTLIENTPHPCETMIAAYFSILDQKRAGDAWLQEVVRWTWKVKLLTHLETDLFSQLRNSAEQSAITVFAHNVKDLLMAAPAGGRTTIGLDPGLRTGVKVAVVDNTGKVVDHTAIYPHAPKNQWDASIETLAKLAKQHNAQLMAIGNGTASRETDQLAADLIKRYPELKLTKAMVSEAGASVYSASEFAAKEFPDLDVTIRGAVSIARRLQDPLAELVKIDPKSIGVGQYQHDVNQSHLAKSLDAVVEDCVNAVGVDINTASAPLLARVAGLNLMTATSIVNYRDQHGGFKNRTQLKSVPRLGEKTFEQCAGFLRVTNGDNPLDASGVHPEAYSVVNKIIVVAQKEIGALLGDSAALKSLNPAQFTDEHFGLPTVTDILKELDKPGRDPRPEFKTATFKDGIEKLSDLIVDMVLEGIVTNVTHFGAFVDIGVHQDGLVHISMLADHFVSDPRTVVKTGDIVRVKVIEVDVARKRVALSRRLNTESVTKNTPKQTPITEQPKSVAKKPTPAKSSAPAVNTRMAELFAAAQQRQDKHSS